MLSPTAMVGGRVINGEWERQMVNTSRRWGALGGVRPPPRPCLPVFPGAPVFPSQFSFGPFGAEGVPGCVGGSDPSCVRSPPGLFCRTRGLNRAVCCSLCFSFPDQRVYYRCGLFSPNLIRLVYHLIQGFGMPV